ncbi:methylated-DNA--[protein]-cysteine S-methyltransferase [Chitinophaga pendula]|nr:glycosyltransferase [Chitinophaga sp. MD30]UCJ10282.1 methylated-DNA--[protein]-cysteine S-methyltransferase [Chitinophaga pendula]
MEYYYKETPSPVGRLKLVASDKGLAAILWENDVPTRTRIRHYEVDEQHPVLLETERQLKEYFKGERKEFELELNPVGTDFQRSVWHILTTIPYGKTLSYGDIARQLGDIKAVRAVGAANGRNPISIVVPCHRVIGASGHLTGFAGGLEAKAYLLTLEGARGNAMQISLTWGEDTAG